MGMTLSVTTGYGVEIDEDAMGRLEDEWNNLHPDEPFEDDPYWCVERLLSNFPEIEVDSFSYMGYEGTYVLWVKGTRESEYGTGVFEHRLHSDSGWEADVLAPAIQKYGIQGEPRFLTGVSYG